jgi:hypothetical protein
VTETQREPVPRVDTSEKDTALAFLSFARHCLVKKLDGLDEEQARRVLVPSGTSLLGLVAHVIDGERYWFGHHVAGDQRWAGVDFEMDTSAPMAEVLAGFDAAVRDSDAILAGVDLDTPVRVPVDGQPLSVRWVLAHTTSEIARHAGHADILRELIDGVTGR